MSGFIEGILAFPTVIFTVLLGVALLYWMFVIVGGVDVDMLGGADGAMDGALDGAMDGALDGAMDGAMDGVADGVLDGAMDGVADGALDGVADGVADGAAEGAAHAGEASGGFLELLSALGLRKAPVTVVFTLLVLWGWIISFATMFYGGAWLAGLIGMTLASLVAFAIACGAALPLASICVRPLAPIFESKPAAGREMLIGRSCTITTGRVDANFGQAEHKSAGESFLINVCCEKPNTLGRGDEALIINVDRARHVYLIEPLDPALLGDGETQGARNKRHRDAAIAEASSATTKPREGG